MPKVQSPSARMSWFQANHPERCPDPTMADKQLLIQAAMEQCNGSIAMIVAEQQSLRRDVSPATAEAFGARYRDLEQRRRGVMELRHQVQVVSFTLETLTIESLAQRIAHMFDTVDSPKSKRPGRPGF
ncbi:MAG TPA: hypothetical protein VD886_02305 [Herpetosiphonaceae bacterium]|nr:hypothetical protein [Herpetosiphonaceae bacterium]